MLPVLRLSHNCRLARLHRQPGLVQTAPAPPANMRRTFSQCAANSGTHQQHLRSARGAQPNPSTNPVPKNPRLGRQTHPHPLLVQALQVAVRVVREQQLPVPVHSKLWVPRQEGLNRRQGPRI